MSLLSILSLMMQLPVQLLLLLAPVFLLLLQCGTMIFIMSELAVLLHLLALLILVPIPPWQVMAVGAAASVEEERNVLPVPEEEELSREVQIIISWECEAS
jgi:hypothetical protein